ncbi:MAG: hypothetical protein N2489_11685 [Clostridia bacterium]|nr:hypothetical protein [Clostridia bacterium]
MKRELKPYAAIGRMRFEPGLTTARELFEYIADVDKFYDWFNFFPHTWMDSKDKKYGVGFVTTCRVIFPPMTYSFYITKISDDLTKIYFDIKGWMNGDGMWEFKEDENGTEIIHIMNLTGMNPFMHHYFKIVKLGHDVYFPWRMKILKKKLEENRRREKQGEMK